MVDNSSKMKNKIQKVERTQLKDNSEHVSKKKATIIFEGKDDDDSSTPFTDIASQIPDLENLQAIDLVFLVDATLSMKAIMNPVKTCIMKIVNDYKSCAAQFLTSTTDVLQVALVVYRDHCDDYVSEILVNLTSDISELESKLKELKAEGGGDVPEAVLDGLSDVLSLSWRSNSFKSLYHFLDAPQHGPQFSDFPDLSGGCTCDLEYRKIFEGIRQLELKYTAFTFSEEVNQMLGLFIDIWPIEIFPVETKCKVGSAVNQLQK